MEKMQNYNMPEDEQEIDIVELIKKMWLNRKLIIKVTLAFMVLGLLAVIFGSKEFTASCDIVPQTSGGSSSKMSSLASLAGISIPQEQDVKMLSPYVYENLLKSTKFRKELMQKEIYFEKAGRPVSIFEYYTSEEFNKPTVIDYIKKYTIGLPGVIIGAIRGEQPEADYSSLKESATKIETTSKDEYNVIQMLENVITIELDDKKGFVTISVVMPEPMAAAQLTQATVDLLQQYITVFKIEKVQSNLDFIQERYDEVKRDFEEIQARRARYRDANQNTIKNFARVELERIEAEYQLTMNVYGELAMQLEQAKIKVKETTPILTIVNPVTVPYKKSSPGIIKIILAFTFLGVMVGMGCVYGLPILVNAFNIKRLKGIVLELPEEDDSLEEE